MVRRSVKLHRKLNQVYVAESSFTEFHFYLEIVKFVLILDLDEPLSLLFCSLNGHFTCG